METGPIIAQLAVNRKGFRLPMRDGNYESYAKLIEASQGFRLPMRDGNLNDRRFKRVTLWVLDYL